MLGAREDQVQHRPPGIGIDLDQLRAMLPDVEIVAHKYTPWAVAIARNLGCRPEDMLPILRLLHDTLDRGDSVSHTLPLLRRDEDRSGGEERRSLTQDRVVESGELGVGFQLAAQELRIQRAAVAAQVQALS